MSRVPAFSPTPEDSPGMFDHHAGLIEETAGARHRAEALATRLAAGWQDQCLDACRTGQCPAGGEAGTEPIRRPLAPWETRRSHIVGVVWGSS